jgi:Ca-activated chloride channel homolog
MRILKSAAMLLLCLTLPLAAAPPGAEELGGTLTAEGTHLPSLKTEYDAEVRGDIAAVTVTQRFVNPGTAPVNATYQFPLPDNAAVHAMRMEIGDEVVEAVIREKDTARRDYEAAKREGRNAALLTQHRPNVFTQEIANLMPGQPITVKLRYVQGVKRVDGAYELVMPLVVGPRYEPPPAKRDLVEVSAGAPAATPQMEARVEPKAAGQWSFDAMPAYPVQAVTGLTLPSTIDADRVAIRVHLATGMPIASVSSATHAITRADRGDGDTVIALQHGRTLDNRDFVLRYALAGAATQAALLTHREDRGGVLSLLIEPPALPAATDISPREIVFLLDCSGSMHGLPIDASKAFVVKALETLRPTDTFRIIRFSDQASEFSAAPLPATPANVRAGMGFVRGLNGEGGTNMSTGIRQALAVAPPAPDSRRIVAFLTDGYIGNEADILRLISETIGDARLFAFGVGTGVNRYLLNEIGRVGAGFTRYMDPTERTETVVAELINRIDAPVLTDISIDWGGLPVQDVTPERIPDLFAGDSLRLMGRFAEARAGRVIVRGRVNGRPAELPLNVTFEGAAPTDAGAALPLMWARAQIDRHMAALIAPAPLRSASSDELQAKVTALGLKYGLATQWTSFVAASHRVANGGAPAADKAVPVPLVAGVGPSAYPLPTATGAPAYAGGSAPEPGLLLGFAVVALLVFMTRQRRRSVAAGTT